MKATALLSWFVAIPLFLVSPSASASDVDTCGLDNPAGDVDLGHGHGDTLGSAIDSQAFFDSIKGSYKILSAGGKVPESNDIGTVEIEPGQAVFTMGYCPPSGGCDPGYYFFEDNKTKVYRKEANGASVHTIVYEDGGKAYRFSWEVSGSEVLFKNFQYTMPDGSVVTLVHTLRKLAAADGFEF